MSDTRRTSRRSWRCSKSGRRTLSPRLTIVNPSMTILNTLDWQHQDQEEELLRLRGGELVGTHGLDAVRNRIVNFVRSETFDVVVGVLILINSLCVGFLGCSWDILFTFVAFGVGPDGGCPAARTGGACQQFSAV